MITCPTATSDESNSKLKSGHLGMEPTKTGFWDQGVSPHFCDIFGIPFHIHKIVFGKPFLLYHRSGFHSLHKNDLLHLLKPAGKKREKICPVVKSIPFKTNRGREKTYSFHQMEDLAWREVFKNVGPGLRCRAILWMDEIRSHHFETMVETIVCWFLQGNHPFLGGALDRFRGLGAWSDPNPRAEARRRCSPRR